MKKVLQIKEGKGYHVLVKRYLIEKYGYQCNKCKLSTWNNLPISLELEHKNGDGHDNRLENVELLCPNCHAQTPTYRAKNKGNGRPERRARYIKGLKF